MKPNALLRAIVFVFGFSAAMCFLPNSIYGQTSAPKNQKTNADENFELNIGESRVTETDYERSTRVSIGDEQDKSGLSVGVGAIVQAQRIDILLRGINGRVRFRASLDEIQKRIEQSAQNRAKTDLSNQ